MMSKILDIPYTISIPTDPQELATMLDLYSNDWATVLQFLSNVAHKQEVELDTIRVAQLIIEGYENE